jgi:hypothetical protein
MEHAKGPVCPSLRWGWRHNCQPLLGDASVIWHDLFGVPPVLANLKTQKDVKKCKFVVQL